MKGILGRKVGMSQVYTEAGHIIPVSIIEVKPNVVSHVFEIKADGYVALQLAIEEKRKSRINKPLEGHFKKANTTPKQFIREIRDMSGFELGSTIDVSIFTKGQLVDVSGTTKGKGFTGAIKRHNQSIGPKSHGGGGGSKPVRQTGSLGDISGNKVVKGMTMPGQMGNNKKTVQNLEVIKIDVKNNILLVKGAIPGPRKSFVIIKDATKKLPSRDGVSLINYNKTEIKKLEEGSK